MITAYSTPTGGVGQPPRPSKRIRQGDGCHNDHSNPERAGDCNCAELAAERAERLSGDCCWPDAVTCRTKRAAATEETGDDWSFCRVHPKGSL